MSSGPPRRPLGQKLGKRSTRGVLLSGRNPLSHVAGSLPPVTVASSGPLGFGPRQLTTDRQGPDLGFLFDIEPGRPLGNWANAIAKRGAAPTPLLNCYFSRRGDG